MQYSDEQITLSLSFLSYLGFYETMLGVQSSERTLHSIQHAIDTSSVLQGDYRVVWGPAMYRLPLTIFDENLMFVVQSKSDPSRYVVVIRGTNPVSISNWILQDFNVLQQTVWPYHKQEGSLTPKLSKGSARGLQALQAMEPRSGLPGYGTSLYQFLASEITKNPSEHITIVVTGHSLGGALAPTVALWLADTQQVTDDPESPPWDVQRKAHIEVFSFAGPSPGNADFATYYDIKLGKSTRRIWNRFDVVPHGWINAALATLPKLYDPDIAPDLLMSLVLWSTTVLARRGNYQHVVAESLAADGCKVTPHLKDYTAQMIFQHTAAYPEILGLLHDLDVTEHFDYEEQIYRAIHASRESGQGNGHGNGAGQDTAEGGVPPPKSRKRRMSGMSKAMHRIYRVPATVALTFIPEAMALPKLKRRKRRFHAELGARHTAAASQ